MIRGFSLSSAGHYLVFDSSDLSIERKELFCIYRLKRFQTDVAVGIRLQVRKARNASTKFRKTLESENSPNPSRRIGAGEISRNLRFSFLLVFFGCVDGCN